MSKRLYVAYGSNLNFKQMKHRCPTAKLYGIGTVYGYELQFKGSPASAFATIMPKEGTSVPVAGAIRKKSFPVRMYFLPSNIQIKYKIKNIASPIKK